MPGLVVAAALLDDAGRVLAAQRSRPAELAGRWEFPGGKVEAGESEQDALVRECREELGVVVWPLDFVAEVPIPADRRLRLWTASLLSGTPQPYEHSELRWVSAGELDALYWLEPDRPLLPPLRALLATSARSGAQRGHGQA